MLERRKFLLYLKLIRFDKPVGTWLLLWPTLTALWLATEGQPSFKLLLIFTLGTFLMRSAGCVLNDIADRDFDRHVARTRERVIASGQVSVKEAALIAVLLLVAAASLLLGMKVLVWWLAGVAVVLAASYPFFKRFFALPQAYLGVAFSFGIPMAFAAVQDHISWQAWALMGVNLCWVLAYDTEYALVDIADDRKLGLKTSAITFGNAVVPAIMFFYGLFITGMAVVGWLFERHSLFFVGVLMSALMAVWHFFLIRHRDPQGCFLAFRYNHWLGAAIFFFCVLDYRFT